MADRTQRLAIVVTAQDLAAGKLKNVRSELAQMGTAGKLASVGLGGVMLVGNKAGQALGNLKSRLTSLAGPLGLIGLSAGALTLTGAFEKGISKATEWGLAIEKLTGLTSNNAEQLSGLLGITEKYGISNERIATIAGFTEKALGKLEMTTVKGAAATKSAALAHLELVKAQRQAAGESVKSIDKLISEQKGRDAVAAAQKGQAAGVTKLTTLAKQYGIVLTNSKGQALDFQSVLLNVADAYSKAKTAADKAKMAALSAALFGRGYADLIPILKLGRKGILDAEQAAKDLGLTLTTQNVADLAKYREAMREASDATSGLELQLGLLVMPDLTTAFKSFVEFMRTHQADAKAFFTGVLHTAEGVVSFVTGTVVPTISGLATVAGGFWNSIPGPLRDFMVKGFVADRTIKFLFGMSPGHLILQLGEQGLAKALGGAVGGFFGRGSFANPMFVKNVGIPGLPVNPTDLLPEAAAATQGIITTVATAAAGLVAILGAPLVATYFAQHGMFGFQPGGENATVPSPPTRFSPIPGSELTNARGVTPNTVGFGNSERAGMLFPATRPPFGFGNSERTGLAAVAPLTAIAGTMTALQQQLHADFRDAIGALRKATDPAAIIAAAKRVTEDTWKGVGSGKTTKATIADLSAKRDVLLAAGDKANAAIIAAEIRKLSPLIAGREHQRQLLAQGAKVAASNESVKQKVADLKGIEQTLLSEHRTTAAATVQALVNILTGVNATTAAVGNITMPTVGNTTPRFDLTDKKPPPKPKPKPSDSSYAGQKTAMGISGYTRGETEIIAGEAGREHVTVIRNPRALTAYQPMGHFGGDASGIIAAINRLRLSVATNVNMGAADVQKARVVRSRIVKPHGSRGSLVGVG